MSNVTDSVAAPEDRLPFDPGTVFIGLWGRRRLIMIAVVLSIVLGIASGLLFGSKTYRSETVLVYQPQTGVFGEHRDALSLTTQMNMVKIQSNLEDVRLQHKLGMTIETLGASIDVNIGRETDLMNIQARSDDRYQAAATANTMRDVFLGNQQVLRRTEIARFIHDIEQRFDTVSKQLEIADTRMQQFMIANRIVDLDKETRWYLEELTSLKELRENANIEYASIELQKENIDRIIDDLKQRVAGEQASVLQTEGLGDLNIRLGRLRNSIHDDRQHRARLAELSLTETEFERAKKLHAKDLISRSDYRKAQAHYDKQKALVVDTAQIKDWKRELEKLDKIVIPNQSKATPSSRLLQDVMMRAFDIELESVAVEEKVKYLRTAGTDIEEKLAMVPLLQRQHVELTREIEMRQGEKRELELMLGDARRAHESELSDYLVVSQATPPMLPLRSTRKPIAVAVAGLILVVAFGLVVAVELFDTTVKSAAELALKTDLPVLGTIPLKKDEVTEDAAVQLEAFRFAAHGIRNALSGRAMRLLVVGAREGEGVSYITAELAACYARQGDRVLIVEPQSHRADPGQESASRSLDKTAVAGLKRLFDDPEIDPAAIIRPGRERGVNVLYSPGLDPDCLGSERMGEILDRAAATHDIVLIDTAAVLPYADAQSLARWADGIVLIVKARACRAPKIRRAIARLSGTNVPLIGVILNAVETPYLEQC